MMRDIKIEMTCPFCGKAHNVEVAECDYNAWQSGELAQRAFPYLTATEREQLISYMCPQCQADFFGEDNDFEDEDPGEDIDECMAESLAFTGQWW